MSIDDPNKIFLKRFLDDKKDEKRKVQELKGNLGGYVESDNQPYDRLRRSLRKLFGPGYPDIFDYSGGNDER